MLSNKQDFFRRLGWFWIWCCSSLPIHLFCVMFLSFVLAGVFRRGPREPDHFAKERMSRWHFIPVPPVGHERGYISKNLGETSPAGSDACQCSVRFHSVILLCSVTSLPSAWLQPDDRWATEALRTRFSAVRQMWDYVETCTQEDFIIEKNWKTYSRPHSYLPHYSSSGSQKMRHLQDRVTWNSLNHSHVLSRLFLPKLINLGAGWPASWQSLIQIWIIHDGKYEASIEWCVKIGTLQRWMKNNIHSQSPTKNAHRLWEKPTNCSKCMTACQEGMKAHLPAADVMFKSEGSDHTNKVTCSTSFFPQLIFPPAA